MTGADSAKGLRKGLLVSFLFLSLCGSVVADDINGAKTCAACTFAVGIVEQLAQVHNSSITDTVKSLCSYLPPGQYRQQCQHIIDQFGAALIELFYVKAPPDVICTVLRLCWTDPGQAKCNLFPRSKVNFYKQVWTHQHVFRKHFPQAPELMTPTFICTLPGIKFICQIIEKFTENHKPFLDLDNDGYSTIETLRGTSWKGQDCSDTSTGVHPGAKPFTKDIEYDTDCNGIYGVDSRGQAYEDLLCPKDLVSRGVACIGDSAMAHFHIPHQWVTPALLTKDILTNLPYVVENEFDWPMMSSTTGFMNITWPIAGGPTKSLYTFLRDRNRCIHRDYQNIAVNGADIFDTQKYQRVLSRNQTNDKPLVIVFGLVGNDVCNRYPDTVAHMTTPEQMRENILKSLTYLNSVVPADSKVLIIGLADGRPLYDSLNERYHPIGQLNKDVTYPDFYEFLNCLQISPCHGWMTKNATLRDETSQRALNLSQVLFEVAKQYKNKFSNLEVNFLDCPFNAVITEWEQTHGPADVYELIERVDGFHPNQFAQELIAEYSNEYLKKYLPHYLGSVNPHNEKIQEIFGDQGGY